MTSFSVSRVIDVFLGNRSTQRHWTMGILKRQLRIGLLAGDLCFEAFVGAGDRRTEYGFLFGNDYDERKPR
jgi:hypothetical protein